MLVNKDDLDLLVSAARAAGQVAMRHWKNDPQVWHKPDDQGPVTEADYEVDALLKTTLCGARPDYGWLSEESADDPARLNAQRVWIVDPIDGTVNYFYGIPHYCVSIALRHKDELIVGVIYDPSMNEMWEVEKGSPALLNGQAISVSPRTKLEESAMIMGCGKDAASLSAGLERFGRASLRARKMRMMGSAALAMAYISSGRLDAYVESTISLWDIAAGQLLLESAGGKSELTPVEGKADVWSIVASNGKIPIEEIL